MALQSQQKYSTSIQEAFGSRARLGLEPRPQHFLSALAALVQ